MFFVNAIIIDDEPGNIITLSEILKSYCPHIIIKGTAPDIDEAYKLIKGIKPDLIFLDIQMPGGNGFDLLNKIKDRSFETIFVTAFDNYAIKAFKYAVLDYILKPVNIDELQTAVEKATDKLQHKQHEERIDRLLENIKKEDASLYRIGLPTINGLYFEDVKAITYLKAEGSYTKVFSESKKEELITKSLKEFEEFLPEALFCRIHHSYLINMNFVKRYFKGRGGYVEMNDGTEIEVSVRKKEEFLKRFKC